MASYDVDANPFARWERNFREQVRRAREARSMTQTDLAKALKAFGLPFHQQTVQRIEQGERPVRLNEAYLIAQVLDLSLDTMTATSTPSARELRFAVDGLRRKAQQEADNIAESMTELEDELGVLLAALQDRLFPEPVIQMEGDPPGKPMHVAPSGSYVETLDKVTRWAVGFVALANEASEMMGRARWELMRLAGTSDDEGWTASDISQFARHVVDTFSDQVGPINAQISSQAWYDSFTEDYDDEEVDRAGDEWAQMQSDIERGK